MICMAAKGFLTQAACGAPAASACSHCGRTMCAAHLSPASGFTMCYDCAATQQPHEAEEAEVELDDTWAHGYRASYYSATGYRPHGSSSTSSFDGSDAAAFDERGEASFDEEGEAGGFDAS